MAARRSTTDPGLLILDVHAEALVQWEHTREGITLWIDRFHAESLWAAIGTALLDENAER